MTGDLEYMLSIHHRYFQLRNFPILFPSPFSRRKRTLNCLFLPSLYGFFFSQIQQFPEIVGGELTKVPKELHHCNPVQIVWFHSKDDEIQLQFFVSLTSQPSALTIHLNEKNIHGLAAART